MVLLSLGQLPPAPLGRHFSTGYPIESEMPFLMSIKSSLSSRKRVNVDIIAHSELIRIDSIHLSMRKLS